MHLAEFFLSGVCHQFPEHSLFLQGQPLPLCARCTGTFLGMLLGLLMLPLLGQGRRARLPGRGVSLALGALGLAWAVDGVHSFLSYVRGAGLLYAPSNAARLFTGLGLGMGLSVVLYAIIHYALWRAPEERRVLEGGRGLAPLLAAEALLGLALLAWRGAPYAAVAWLEVLAVAVALTATNGALAALLWRSVRPVGARALPMLAVGLAAGLAETGTLALVRQWLGAF